VLCPPLPPFHRVDCVLCAAMPPSDHTGCSTRPCPREMQDSMANQPTMEDLFSGKAFKDLEEKEDKKGEGSKEGKKTGKEVRAEKRSQ